ncbi:MAG: GDP-mannose 4,6-dehydratase [Lentimicrobium sp.]|jgi:UDP-glucuronate 4-epimerase|nr:GDP-mannose 4,6-dehydratase [Lentimicrobium sp.]MDD2528046.1 GDP-mannose 4,6-dehydratase [Lentimicrobiaceae bacterium]MDD4597675.1 GDP-mannose 4,6-dehydratase [Lentimicrobiaceae bacterium]MDY0025565.1 GDP-mannose 4,6-dehydratase [Lentimicrobium sp.]HAH57972.1 epimerase [Bacteroidales bacterium]
MKSVLITGAAGFIGSNLSKKMLHKGFRVFGIDNFDGFYDPAIKRKAISKLESPDFSLFEGDIRDRNFLDEVLKTTQPALVVHLAARAGVRPSIEQPELYYDVNVTGTLTLLEAMRNAGIKDLLFASSSSVYGNNKKVPFSESDAVDNPISPYAATKKAGELLCYTYHHLYNFNIFCLRFFTVYGPGQRPEMAIQQFGRKIISNEPITLFGDGSTRRDYTFIDDITDGIIACAHNLKGYEILNLGNSQTITLIDLVRSIEETLGHKATIKWEPMQAGDVEITYADIDKARQLIGFNPGFPVKEGLKKMFGEQSRD